MTEQAKGAEYEFRKDMHQRVLQIIEILHGLDITQADGLLRETSRTLALMHRIDVTSEGYKAFVKTFNETFGENKATHSRQ